MAHSVYGRALARVPLLSHPVTSFTPHDATDDSFRAPCSKRAVLACGRSTPATSPSPAGAGGPYDVIIENGRIVDGTGAAWLYGDLAIRGDRIAAVAPRGTLRGGTAKTRVDARDLVVAPGFIDIQDQSGGQLLLGDGRQLGKITQGVTTGILGEGSTPAPLNPALLPTSATDLQETFRGSPRIRRVARRHGGARHLAQRRLVHRRRDGARVREGEAMGAATPRSSTRCAPSCDARWRTARSASARR